MPFRVTPLFDFSQSARLRGTGLLAEALLALFLFLTPTGAEGGAAVVISWNVPATYDNQSVIPATVRQKIETRLYFSLDGAAWTRFATVPQGGNSWSGTLPVADGITGYYAATAAIPPDGAESRMSEVVVYPPGGSSADRFDEITVTLGSYQDTYVAPADGVNRSSDPLVRTLVWPERTVGSRGFLKWDLTSLPAGVRITNAALRLHYVGEEAGGGDNAFAIKVSKVVGVNPDVGKATWASPDNVVSWSGGADGGARDLAVAEATVAVGKNRGGVVWNISNMAQEWVETPGANFGVALDPDVSATPGSNRDFASGEHPDPRLRPELVITYRQPSQNPVPPVPSLPPPPSTVTPPGALPDMFTASIGAYEDTYVNQGSYSDVNYSAEPLIRTYTWPTNTVANRGFIRWDLSGLPDNITVANATLWLYYVDEEGGGKDNTYTVSVSKVTGVLPDLGRATWNRYDGLSPWPGGQNGGAAAMGTAESSATIGKVHRWVSWDVTGMVQDWVAGPETNFGMVINGDPSARANSNRNFASREYPDLLLRPRLLVTYIENP